CSRQVRSERQANRLTHDIRLDRKCSNFDKPRSVRACFVSGLPTAFTNRGPDFGSLMARYCFIANTGQRGVFVPPMVIVCPTQKGSVLDSFIYINMAAVGWISLEKTASSGMR
ncbi:Hypothetical predicted protein, partial [Paramuricea clavata]